MPTTHCVALFSTKSLTSGLADRRSKVADVPVAPDMVWPSSSAESAIGNFC